MQSVGDWAAYEDDDHPGDWYYYNATTQQTTWDAPDDRLIGAAAAPAAPAAPAPAAPAAPAPVSVSELTGNPLRDSLTKHVGRVDSGLSDPSSRQSMAAAGLESISERYVPSADAQGPAGAAVVAAAQQMTDAVHAQHTERLTYSPGSALPPPPPLASLPPLPELPAPPGHALALPPGARESKTLAAVRKKAPPQRPQQLTQAEKIAAESAARLVKARAAADERWHESCKACKTRDASSLFSAAVFGEERFSAMDDQTGYAERQEVLAARLAVSC